MATPSEWKKLKEIISGRNPLKNLKASVPSFLKNLQNEHGKNLLHVATKHASLAVTKYLVEIGLEIDKKDENARTPLTCAFIRNDNESKKIITFLIISGADVSWENISSENQSDILFYNKNNAATALLSAIKKREGTNQAVVNHLLMKDWTFDNIACLHNEGVTKLALKSDHNLEKSFKNLNEAVSKEDVDGFKRNLELVAHSKRILSWALLWASRTRSSKSPLFIKLLLDHGAPINGFFGEETTPLLRALLSRSIDNMWILLDHGAKFGCFNYPSERTYVLLDQEEEDVREHGNNCIRLLIEHRGILNCSDYLILLLKKERALVENWSCGFSFPVSDHICTEYQLMQRYLKGQDCSGIVDNFGCCDELEKMKNFKITEDVNLWDLLPKTIDEVVPLTKNDYLMKKIKSESFIDLFPRYGKSVQLKLKKALEKRLMINNSIDILSKCLPLVGSSLPILEKIVTHLGGFNSLLLE